MAEAKEGTVLGDFADAEVTAHGVTSRFFRRDGGYFIRTDGPDGELREFPIKYSFGWYPLQQYLIELPRGRLQSLGLAWDSRPAAEGGRKWFHLYPDEEGMDHKHPLHWTAPDQNWNYQCAECHSTDLKKNYDLQADAFQTTWAEINVACEACHGPGSRHRAQAEAVANGDAAAWDAGKGLVLDLADRDGGAWSMDPQTGKPIRSVPRMDRTEIELCARCHSRRGLIHDDYRHGKSLGDSHRLSLLEEHLYHPDGQIKDEVYVYGSFIQSRMYREGVTCTDCHDAHSLRLKAEGNLVCAGCHDAGRYDSQTHHHHTPGTQGTTCVSCHMPQQLYMVNDERADHSMRVPRPDLSLELGTPNACNQCHKDKPVQWSVDAIAQWYGEKSDSADHFGRALRAGRDGEPDAGKRLMDLAVDTGQPGIARASALDLLRARPEPAYLLSLPRLLRDPDALVRAAAVRYLEVTDPQTQFKLGMALLGDPVRVVRLEAARTLAPLIRFDLPETERELLDAALEAYLAAQRINAERPESHLNIGLVAMAQGKAAMAQKAYRTAMRLDPGFVPAYVNLSDLYRALGSDREGEEILLTGLEVAPQSADLHHALGLLYIRGKRLDDALTELGRAAELAPHRSRYGYVYALALKETGNVKGALEVLETARKSHPVNRELLTALATINLDAGDRAAALEYAETLLQSYPEDRDAANLVRALKGVRAK
jgi:predicted CXXCH cytochrome family protein